MTRESKDRIFKVMSTTGKWVRKYINKRLGRAMVDFTQDMWNRSLEKNPIR